MKNLKLNLKGLYGYRQSLLSRSPQPRDNREMSERRPSEERTLLAPITMRFARYAAMLIMLLTLGVGQMWATVTIYAVGNMQDNGGTWHDEKTTLKCHNWGTTETSWPGTTMTKWNDVSVDGHQVFKCDLAHDNNSYCIFNNSWQTNNISLTSTIKAYPYPTYLNGDWVYSPRVAKALWEGDQHAYGGRVYFDNSSANWSSTYMYLVIGHATYVGYYRMNQIDNTKLYYVDLGSQSWGDSKYVAVVGHSSSKSTGSGNPNNLAALNKFSDVVNYSLDYESTYLVSMSSGTNCTPISIDYQSSGYSAFNSTQTINTVVKAAGGSYTAANSKATISITSYEMTDNGSVTKRTPSISTSAKTATVSAARTATTTLEVGEVATGYQFDGWYTGATSGTKLSSSTTYTYYPTAATTVYARFSEKTFTVTVTNDGNGTTSPSGAQSNKGQITGIAISATPSDGYNFNNWTITSGTGSFADATDESTTFYPTGTATIRANFVSAATSTLTVTATTGGSITTPAEGYYSDISETSYDIVASRSEGYKFTGWTKTAGDGAVSFSDASALSTTATITTLGDVTVTAGFAAMSNSLSVSSSSVYAGSNVTLNATKTNHTLDLKYQYKIGSGSWNTITTKSGTSHTYTIPYANTYQTYYFRVVSTDGSTDIISPTQTVEVKGRITIHVKNTNSWATMKLYSWYNDGSDHATNGAWNGTTGSGSNGQSCSVHATGSQWWDVTITQTTSNAQKFILSCSTSGDQNKTADLNLSSFTHDAYYAMSTNGSSAQTLSTTTTPAAPTVSTLTAGTIRETSAVLGGNIANAAALGNDIITERGYYWSTNSGLSSSNLGVGEKVTISGTQSAAGNFSGTKSGLTAGTTYYFLAYAKNGYGTGYSSVQNFTTLSTYTVTVTAGAGGSASPSSVTAGQYLASGTITASANTDYIFYNWTKTSGSGTVTFTNANAASTTLKSTNTATVRANFVDMWNVKGSWDSWAAYEPMTATGVSNTYSATKTLAAKTAYHIKVVKRVDNNSSNDKWYGVNGGTTVSRATGSVTGLEENGGETEYITFTTDAAGDYTITYLYNASVGSMKVTVGYPEAYTMTFAPKTFLNGSSTGTTSTTGGTLTAKDQTNASLSTGDKVKNGGSAIFTATKNTGYTFNGFYKNEVCTTAYAAGSGVAIDDNVLTLSSLSADKSVYAKFSENMTTVNLVASPSGKGTFTKGGAAVTSVSAGVTTKPEVTAVPGTGYLLTGTIWSESRDYISISSTTTAATTITATGATGQTANLTATFTPITYTIAFSANGGTGTMTNQTGVTYDASTAIKSNTFTKTGYNFAGWATSAGGEVVRADGAAHGNLSSTQGATVTLYAKWTPKQSALTLDYQTSATGYGSSGSISNTEGLKGTYDAAMTALTGTMPTAANGYAFMGFYDATGGGGTKYYNADGTSAATWDKNTESGTTLYAYYKQAEITGITFTDGAVVAPNTSKTVTAVISPTPTGTTTVCWRVLYSNDNPLDPQPDFSSVSGNSVSFTAPATSGMYKMEAVLHLGSGCSGDELSIYVANFQVAGDHEVTVQYKDASGNVIAASGSVTGKPLEWTEVVAHEIFGYTYSGMTAGDGVTLRDTTADRLTELQAEDPTIVGVKRMKAVYDGKLTINYTQNQMIYFKNTLGWENVYVNFHTGNAWNNTDNGSGSPKGVGNSGLTNANKHMTRIGDTDVWYYDYGYNNGGSSISPSLYISFTDQSRPSASEFWGANPGINVSYPANYADAISTDKSSENGFKAATPMFVPLSGVDPAAANVGGGGKANYYNRGYWTTYTAGTGYTLEIYYDLDESSCIQSIPFTSADDLMPMSAVVDLEAGTTYRYQVRRGGTSSAGIYYGNTGTMTYADHGVGTGWIMENTMAGGFKKAKITTNASGNYTFNLSYSPNASNEYRLRMEVDYPIANNDYRLVYSDATQTKPIISAIVTKANNSKDTVSFFIRPASAALVIQQATVTKEGAITWNAYSTITSWVSGLAKDSVYNICLTMNESGAISVENVEAYTGNFYIRTNAAGSSKWDNFRSSDHLMTYSEYSATNADYSHYFMAYVGNGTNVKFVVANDYAPNISDTVIVQTYRDGDASHVDEDGNIKADANVRFMWNRHNNGAYRAYLAAAKSDGSKFLVLRANSNTDLMDENGNALLESATSDQAGYNHGAPNNSMQFIDDENWIYETTVKIKPGAFLKLYANFHNADFYYKGVNNNTFDKDNAIQLLGGSGDAEKIRVIYDFKTDRLVSAWMPTGDINEVKEIYADVMFVREHQGDIEQLTFSKGDGETMGAITKIETAYGVLRFNKWTINNKSKADGHAVLDPGASRYERDLFYVSFPFRVAMNEVFGFGTYGKHWIIEYYDGAARAANGFWADTPSYWRFVTDRKGKFFEPNQGYIIALDLDEMGESSEVWDNGVENVELYFPSYGEMGDITNAEVTYELPEHECTINRPTPDGNRTIKDSHWNVMSVPTYVNTSNVTFSNTTWTATRPSFLYEWNSGDNSLTPRSGSGYTYHAMHAYMVQYYDDVTWKSTSVTPSSIVARRAYAEAPSEVEFRLELSQNEQMADQTFVRLSNDDEVSTGFAFGEDMSKEFNKTRSNIYTFIGTEQVAGNVLPMSNQTTIVPVGVIAKTDGDYTFAIPEGTNGVGVTLIDTETGVRTSLSALDYTVGLSAGTYNERFYLEISPIRPISTDLEAVTGDGLQVTGARKVMIDGLLYIVKDGKMFDARGAVVK